MTLPIVVMSLRLNFNVPFFYFFFFSNSLASFLRLYLFGATQRVPMFLRAILLNAPPLSSSFSYLPSSTSSYHFSISYLCDFPARRAKREFHPFKSRIKIVFWIFASYASKVWIYGMTPVTTSLSLSIRPSIFPSHFVRSR